MEGVTSTTTVAARLRAQAGNQRGLITTAQCRELGLSRAELRSLLRGGELRPLCRGVYLLDPHLADDAEVEVLRLRAALLALGPESVVVLGSAAHFYGIEGLPLPRRPDVSRPRPSRRAHRPEFAVHHLSLPPEHVVERDGLRLTTPLRTVVDLLYRLDRNHAVSVADSALRLGLLDADEWAEVRRLLPLRPGGGRAARWLALVDGRAESPLETRVRLACHDGGVAPDELQLPIHDEHGRLLGIADMAWKRQRLIAEADGASVHAQPEALLRDRRRQNDLANAGWTVLRFTWSDLGRSDYIAATVRQALMRAA